MADFTEELIAMQTNLGLGHKGEIIITTQERVFNNQPMIAKDIIDVEYAYELIKRWNSQPDLYEACKAAQIMLLQTSWSGGVEMDIVTNALAKADKN